MPWLQLGIARLRALRFAIESTFLTPVEEAELLDERSHVDTSNLPVEPRCYYLFRKCSEN